MLKDTSSKNGTGEEPSIDAKAYHVICGHDKKGISQSGLWKELGITSRDASRIARRLEKKKWIRRSKVLEQGRWTYLLREVKSIRRLLDVEIRGGTQPSQAEVRQTKELTKAWRWQQDALKTGRMVVEKALAELDAVLRRLKLGERSNEVATESHAILKRAILSGFGTGRRPDALMAVSIYAACRKLGVPIHINDIMVSSWVGKEFPRAQYRKVITAYYREMHLRGLIEVPLPSPSIQLDRILAKLQDVGILSTDSAPGVRARALQIITTAQETEISTGKDPAGVAAGAIYCACDGRVPQELIAKAAIVTEVTVRHNYQLLKSIGLNTGTSLSLNQG
jgi:transcription initiation factor TFIIIB Brf1 subunit/transcription initiation factor TFIIB